MPARHEKMIFKNFLQLRLCDTFFENLDLLEQNGEEIIKIGPFLADLWTFEVVYVCDVRCRRHRRLYKNVFRPLGL